VKEKALSCAGLRDLQRTFSPAWLRNFVAAYGLARSTAAYGGLRRRLWGLSVMHGAAFAAIALNIRLQVADVVCDIAYPFRWLNHRNRRRKSQISGSD